MNSVHLMGRLTRDPEIKVSQTANGQMTVARYTLAVDRRYKKDGEQSADFISCVAFGKSGEFAEKYLHKGTKIAITGRIQTGSYTNKDGAKVYTTDVVAEEHEFCESKAVAQNTETSAPEQSGNPTTTAEANDFMSIIDNVEDDGLPFN